MNKNTYKNNNLFNHVLLGISFVFIFFSQYSLASEQHNQKYLLEYGFDTSEIERGENSNPEDGGLSEQDNFLGDTLRLELYSLNYLTQSTATTPAPYSPKHFFSIRAPPFHT